MFFTDAWQSQRSSLYHCLVFITLYLQYAQQVQLCVSFNLDYTVCSCRRLAKSTLILIPLFGVHYIVFIGVPDNVEPTAEVAKLYFEMFFNSLQVSVPC